jgi:hypothetical protein
MAFSRYPRSHNGKNRVHLLIACISPSPPFLKKQGKSAGFNSLFSEIPTLIPHTVVFYSQYIQIAITHYLELTLLVYIKIINCQDEK